MSSKRAKAKTTKKRPQRATSNVFAMFDQSQIQEFKEAFNMIDQNRDGFIDKEDLHDMLASLGQSPPVADSLGPCTTGVIPRLVETCREEPHRRVPGGHDERGAGAHQLHHVPHHVRGEAERHRPGGRHPQCLCLLRRGGVRYGHCLHSPVPPAWALYPSGV
uniref:Myosin light chain 9 n=1 Tax=Aquila chrysaetos chrysaetos TaxID=223781 RepID=A0A663DYA9_AQUCH